MGRWLYFLSLLFVNFVVLQSSLAASNRNVVYQGRILRPDGDPVNSGNITFSVKVYSPAPSSCLLYSETQTVNMTNSLGTFSLNIGEGSATGGVAQASLPTIWTNAGTLSGLVCASGATYSPAVSDERVLQVSFVDAGVSVTLAPLSIRAVPYALQAENLSGYGIMNVAKISGAGSANSLTGPQFDFLTNVAAPALANAAPCVAGEILKYNGSAWACAADNTGGAMGDADYAVKGVVRFDTDAATSGLTVIAGVVSVNSGVGASQILKLDGAGKIPAVDGSQITNLNPANLSAAVSVAKGGTGLAALGTSNQVLGVNNAGTLAEYKTLTAGSGITVTHGVGTVTIAATGAGITSLGGQSGTTQTFAAGSAGNSPAISSAGDIHTLNVPLASAGAGVTSGTISNADYLAFSAKLGAASAFSGDVSGTSSTTSVDKLKGTALSIAALTSGDLLRYNGTNWVNTASLGVSNGGTGATSFAADKVITTNGSGNAFQATSCGQDQVISFTAGGAITCANVNSLFAGFVNGGNSFAANATIGTNDNFKLGLKTNNTTQMTIDTAGNVGVGTAAPVDPLSIGTPVSASATHASVNLSNTALVGGSASGTYVGANPAAFSGNFIDLQVAGASKFKVDNTGKVYGDGSGLSNITGSISGLTGGKLPKAGSATTLVDSIITESGGALSVAANSASTGLAVAQAGAGYSATFMGGNVGVGTATPAYKLDVNGGMRTSFIDGIGTADLTLNTTSTYSLLFSVNNSEKMRIVNSGNVGIGTTTPQSSLDIGMGSSTYAVAGTNLSVGANATNAFYPNIQSSNKTYLHFTGWGSESAFNVGVGAYQNSNQSLAGTWLTAQRTAANFFTNYYGDGLNFYSDTGLTAGVAYAPTLRFSVSPVGNGYFYGNVGIGNPSPAAKLEVDGASGSTLKIVDGNQGAGKVLTSDAAGQASWQTPAGSAALSGITAAAAANSINNAAYAQTWNWQLTGNTTAFYLTENAASTGGTGTQDLVKIKTLNASTANPFHVMAGLNDGIMVDSSGKVGVGSSSPGAKLHVYNGVSSPPDTSGNAQTAAALRLQGAFSAGVLDIGDDTVGTWWLQSTNKNDLSLNYPMALNPNGGSVGVGTLTPVDPFSIGTAVPASATQALVNLSNTALVGASANGTYMGVNPAAYTGDFMNFQIAGTSKFKLDQYGSVSFAAAATSGNLSNVNSVGFKTAGLSLYEQSGSIELDLPNSTTKAFGVYNSNLDPLLYVKANGNVGIGTTSPSAPLDVKGAIRMSGATSGYTGFQPAAAAGSTVYTLPAADGTANQVLSTNGSATLSWNNVPKVSATLSLTNLSSSQNNTLIATAPTGLYRLTAYSHNTTAASSGAGCSLAVKYFFSPEAGSAFNTTMFSMSGTAGGVSNGTFTFYHADSAFDIRLDTIRTAGTCVGDVYRVDGFLELIKAY